MEESTDTNKLVTKKKRVLIGVAIILILCIIGVSAYVWTENTKKKEITAYAKNLTVASLEMVTLSAKAESMINEYSAVWHDAIYNDKAYVNGQWAYTFDYALQLQRTAFENNGDIEKLKVSRAEIEKRLKDLNNPPAEFKETYDLIVKLFGVCNQYAS